MPFGSLWGSALHAVGGGDNRITEDFISSAGITLTVDLTAGTQTHLVDGTEVEGVSVQVAVSPLKSGEFKMQGIEGESSKEQSAGEMTLGSDLSSTLLETVGKVENEEWDQGEENEESEDRDFSCSVPGIISDSPCLISSFSVKFISSAIYGFWSIGKFPKSSPR